MTTAWEELEMAVEWKTERERIGDSGNSSRDNEEGTREWEGARGTGVRELKLRRNIGTGT